MAIRIARSVPLVAVFTGGGILLALATIVLVVAQTVS